MNEKVSIHKKDFLISKNCLVRKNNLLLHRSRKFFVVFSPTYPIVKGQDEKKLNMCTGTLHKFAINSCSVIFLFYLHPDDPERQDTYCPMSTRLEDGWL